MTAQSPGTIPDPLTVGTTFLKQYYHVLTTSPDMIYKFYRPSSVLSQGEGSNPSSPANLEALRSNQSSALKDRFFSWARSASDPIRFELENGSIDAQDSVGGGVLLVVTGHLYLGEICRPFCHTFFLNVFSSVDSKKRQFYIHNDVLRFLQEDSPPMRESALTAVAEEENEDVESDSEDATVDATSVETKENTNESRDQKNFLETEAISAENLRGIDNDNHHDLTEADRETPVVDQEVDERSNRREKRGRSHRTERNHTKSQSDEHQLSPKTTPGSWASLVASGPSTSPTLPTAAGNTLSRSDSRPKLDSSQKSDSVQSKTPKSEIKPRQNKRDPDCTLVIKNLADGTTESDVRSLFEPFAQQTGSSIKGITVSSHRGLAFVDYDMTAPVLAALNHKDTIELHGRQLDIEQKTLDRSRRGAGNNRYRGDVSGNGNSSKAGRSGSGHRHRSSGRNDRGRNARAGK
mmetsp:Transcript_7654/g.13243  ORF Transcript_7654/g.13243 Transcript_7654/m.13243 type:complete len:464 (-) Transcript_7654:139-1530(-)|eukprot:CAMPEP_0116541478 /NCGR_PEP_ID=MMETSP0397-20121206/504_1 /TAXON_ID=216820 /ORGANISM="Cyclophora tenuis, Strain ECT3854" /LENGTH=463 /DNA_ID=CAMNT_0004065423 /DNA_START=27 /DNA_END=1418 /DNA_ORIENTATION=-